MRGLLVLVIVCICEGQLTVKRSKTSDSSEVSLLREELKLLKEEVRRSNARLEKALQENLDLLNEREARLASSFMARYLTHREHMKLYGRGERVIFPESVYNQGGHYNTSSGEYSCPVTGVYFFSFSVYGFGIQDGDNSRVSVVLTRAGERQAEAAVFNEGTDNLEITSSQSLVINCNAGERVWIETVHINIKLYGYRNPNVFSGFLLAVA